MTAPEWLVARPIAHRGLHDPAQGLFENTIGAAGAAIAAGYAIECDAQATADGDAVVFHDFDLDRLTAESGLIRDRHAGELSAIPVGGTDDCIPPLADFLAFVAGRVPVVLELKSRFDGDLALAHRVVALASAYPGPIAVKSWDVDVLAHLHAAAPGLLRGVVARASFEDPHWSGLSAERKAAMANLLHFEATRPDFISWCVDDLPHAAPHLSRLLAGLPVMAWTVRTHEQRRRARFHADQIVFEGFLPQP